MTNFRLNLVTKNDVILPSKYGHFYQIRILRFFCIYSLSIGDRENLRVLNFIQIYLFLLFQTAILDFLVRISEL